MVPGYSLLSSSKVCVVYLHGVVITIINGVLSMTTACMCPFQCILVCAASTYNCMYAKNLGCMLADIWLTTQPGLYVCSCTLDPRLRPKYMEAGSGMATMYHTTCNTESACTREGSVLHLHCKWSGSLPSIAMLCVQLSDVSHIDSQSSTFQWFNLIYCP